MARHDNDGIYQRKDGRYATSITLENHKRKYIYGKTKQEVREKRRKALREQEQGRLATGPRQTVKDFLNYWLEEVHRASLKISTYALYRRHLDKHIIPALGYIQLRQLTTDQVQAFCSKKLREGLAGGTVKLLLIILDEALKDAVKWHRISTNVCAMVTPPKITPHEIQPLTREQAQKLLAVAQGSRISCLLTLAIATGMRLGEILALRWSDLNLDEGMLQVRHTVDFIQKHGLVESDPKTASSKRSIALPQFVVDALKQQHTIVLEAQAQAGLKWQDKGLVFPNRRGNYFSRSWLTSIFKKLLQEAGLPDMRFHDLRHSAATILLTMGVHPKVVQEILGHSNISITLNTYSHVLPSMQRDAMNDMDAFFREKK